MKLIRFNNEPLSISLDEISTISPNNNAIRVQLKNGDTITGHFISND